MADIVRTDTLFGSKKNIVGSTSADLVLETLGKVYIKTGKSTKTLTEILSEYSKSGEGKNNTSIDAGEISKILSAEYMEDLIIQVLNKKRIFGEFVTIDSVRSKGNENLPIYFDSNAEAQTILGLSVKNKIETEDIVYGQKGVATSGMCDLTISGGYGGGGINEESLEIYLSNNHYVTETQLNTFLRDEITPSFKQIQSEVEINNNDSTKTLTYLQQNNQGEIVDWTFSDIPDAGESQKGLVNITTQTFYGQKSFNNNIIANAGVTLSENYFLRSYIGNTAGTRNLIGKDPNNVIILSDLNSNLKIRGQDISFYLKPQSTEVLSATLNEFGLHVEQGVSCEGICDLTIDPVNAKIQSLENRIYALEHPNE